MTWSLVGRAHGQAAVRDLLGNHSNLTGHRPGEATTQIPHPRQPYHQGALLLRVTRRFAIEAVQIETKPKVKCVFGIHNLQMEAAYVATGTPTLNSVTGARTHRYGVGPHFWVRFVQPKTE